MRKISILVALLATAAGTVWTDQPCHGARFGRRGWRCRCQDSNLSDPRVSDPIAPGAPDAIASRAPDPRELESPNSGRWPGADASLESLRSRTTAVVAVAALGPVQKGKTYAAHVSTAMDAGGRTIRGGGIVISTECRQEFRITEVLHGTARPEKRTVEYVIVESRAFPGPASSAPIPAGARTLLLLDEKGRLLQALPDNPENRRAVQDAFSRG